MRKALSARIAALMLGLAMVTLHPVRALAQDQGVVVEPEAASEPSVNPELEPGDGARKTARKVTPLITPIPFKNSQIGWGLMLMGGLIHKFDNDSTIKPSTGLVGGFASENGSWGVMAVEDARLGHDRWRVRALLSHMEIRYDYFGIGDSAGTAGKSVAVQQNMNMALVSGLMRVSRGLYFGPTLLWMNAAIALRDTAGHGLPPSAADTTELNLFAPGVMGEYDTRNSDYWPTHGHLVRVRGTFALSDSRDFQRYAAYWSWYTPVKTDRLVLATNVNACGTGGDAPFWALCSVGAGKGGLRGYTQGRYRDALMLTAQAEARYVVWKRFAATAFAGIGDVAPEFSDLLSSDVLPAGGVGLRYRLTRKYPMHVRVDYAWGKDGGILYFGLGEAF